MKNKIVRLSEEEEKARENTLEEETSIFSLFGLEEKNSIIDLWKTILYRIKKLCDSIIGMMQRVFRPYHLSDLDVWNFDTAMAKWIYPRLKIFIARERFGCPGIFAEYDEDTWSSEEAYNEAVKNGGHLGGGKEAWEQVLQEMLFAFEWKLQYECKEQYDEFCKKWNIKNPHEKNIENKEVIYNDYGRHVHYYNAKLDMQIRERAQKGFALFGEYFTDLWL